MKKYYHKGQRVTDYEDGFPSAYVAGYRVDEEHAKQILSSILADKSVIPNFFVVSDLSKDQVPSEFNPRWCNKKYYTEVDFNGESEKWIRKNSIHWILVNGATKEIFNWCPQLDEAYIKD